MNLCNNLDGDKKIMNLENLNLKGEDGLLKCYDYCLLSGGRCPYQGREEDCPDNNLESLNNDYIMNF